MRAEHERRDPAGDRRERAWHPVARVHRADEKLTFTIELPGVAASRVCVTAEHDVLTVRGDRAARRSRPAVARDARDDARDDARERHDDDGFVYHFRLPPGVDPTSIRADHGDGVLSVHVPNPARFRRTDIAVVLVRRSAAHARRGRAAGRAVPAGTPVRSPRAPADEDDAPAPPGTRA
jgi:HSP20 family molecular chaperone IbpA